MANTIANLTNINFLTKTQYDSIASPADSELYAVDVATDSDFKATLHTIPEFASGSYSESTMPYTATVDCLACFNVSHSSTGTKNFDYYVNGAHIGGDSMTAALTAVHYVYLNAGDVLSFSNSGTTSLNRVLVHPL